MIPTIHIPVLAQEIIDWSNLSAGSVCVDGTVGGGGHASMLLERLLPGGKLIGVDRDPRALERARKTLEAKSQSIEQASNGQLKPIEGREWFLHQGTYADLPEILQQLEIASVDCILLDLGLSSDQLADRDRGFSFREDGPLDLRFDDQRGPTAADLLNRMNEEDIANTIYEFGEERFSRRIARAIVEQRRVEPIRTTKQLSDLVHRNVPGPSHGRIDKATRTFQALRIAVNSELKHLEVALKDLPPLLSLGGRLLVISFHSLEDRPVKNAFRETEILENLTKKPITASSGELGRNSRSRSAKLRVAQRRES